MTNGKGYIANTYIKMWWFMVIWQVLSLSFISSLIGCCGTILTINKWGEDDRGWRTWLRPSWRHFGICGRLPVSGALGGSRLVALLERWKVLDRGWKSEWMKEAGPTLESLRGRHTVASLRIDPAVGRSLAPVCESPGVRVRNQLQKEERGDSWSACV